MKTRSKKEGEESFTAETIADMVKTMKKTKKDLFNITIEKASEIFKAFESKEFDKVDMKTIIF